MELRHRSFYVTLPVPRQHSIRDRTSSNGENPLPRVPTSLHLQTRIPDEHPAQPMLPTPGLSPSTIEARESSLVHGSL